MCESVFVCMCVFLYCVYVFVCVCLKVLYLCVLKCELSYPIYFINVFFNLNKVCLYLFSVFKKREERFSDKSHHILALKQNSLSFCKSEASMLWLQFKKVDLDWKRVQCWGYSDRINNGEKYIMIKGLLFTNLRLSSLLNLNPPPPPTYPSPSPPSLLLNTV